MLRYVSLPPEALGEQKWLAYAESRWEPRDGRRVALKADAASGLPAAVRASLFQPVVSTKRHGGGMGLAISRRLARHAGGDLLLERTGPDGTTFVLRVPAWRISSRGAV